MLLSGAFLTSHAILLSLSISLGGFGINKWVNGFILVLISGLSYKLLASYFPVNTHNQHTNPPEQKEIERLSEDRIYLELLLMI